MVLSDLRRLRDGRRCRLVPISVRMLAVLLVMVALTVGGVGIAAVDHSGPVCPTGDLAEHNEGQRAFGASERAGTAGPLNAYAPDRGISVAQESISDTPPQCDET